MATETMQTVLVDTDVAIDFLRGNAYAKELLENLWSEGRASISTLSVYELDAGMRDHERKATKAFIDACRIDDVTREIAEKAGELRREYQKRGITIPSMDCIIAATALVSGYKIATRNKRHFPESLMLGV
ncbi:MAG: type II toxin-antitoxin system VapC family toxin [Deltaproteobacteria bacterium]|nr:type II toxin-antitoxin system VapC family toxin [Deltaproteobacteria bacterium]